VGEASKGEEYFMRTPFFVVLLSALFLFSLEIPLHSSTIPGSLDFDIEGLAVSNASGYDHVFMRGCDLSDRVGEPALPVYLHHVSLPAGARLTGVRLLRTRDEVLAGTYLPFPAQPPAILAIPGKEVPAPRFVKPEPEVYGSRTPYPVRIVEVAGSGRLGSSSVGAVLVSPVSYLPGERKLVFHSRVDFEIEYEIAAPAGPGIPEKTGISGAALQRMYSALTGEAGPSPATRESRGTMVPLRDDEYPYVLVTSEALRPAFLPLVEWKTRKGMRGILITTEYIDQNYTGTDLQEKIRNFITDASLNYSTQWVLLGGDTNIIPTRIAWAMDCEAGYYPDENDLQADLYYADLDGTWNANGNGTYGEVDDEVDMYPDVFVGRASVESVAEAEAFVSKILAYERTPTPDYQTSITMAAEILWTNPYTDASVGADMIDSLYIPSRFDPITKLYQSRGNENSSTVIAALNEGQNIFSHAGHCSYDYMNMGDGGLDNWDMDNLENGERCGILYSIGCWPAALDYDCIAEHFVQNPDGGGIAFIGNSRYGWGSPGNPGYGYSERFVHQFYRYLFVEGFARPSEALAMSKSYYVSRSQTENVYRIHEYQVNLLGDPEMTLWTDIPGLLSVTHPDTISGEEQVLPVTVRTPDGPVVDALVCIMGDDFYRVGRTDVSGRVVLETVPASEESLFVTVTGPDVLPYESVMRIAPTGPFVTVIDAEVSDQEGNGDGLINPGEEVTLTIEVRNTGTEGLLGLAALLDLEDEYCVLLDSSETFGDLAAGDTAFGESGVRLQVASNTPTGHLVFLPIAITDTGGHVWSGCFSLLVRTPSLGCHLYGLDDIESGDGDSLLDPGESAQLFICVGNSGLGYAHDVTAHLTPLGSGMVFPETSLTLGSMMPGADDTLSLDITGDPEAQTPGFPLLLLELFDAEGHSVTDTVIVTMGTERLSDDFEAGEGRWRHEGTYDEWHLSTARYNSEGHSWYSGVEPTFEYKNQMNANLLPPAVFIAPQARVSFWCWYEVTTYGVDGLYVEANDGSGWQMLDFVGSGGALDSLLNTGNLWHRESYDLSRYPVGTRVELRFRFSSDRTDVAEGFYIDDVSSNCPIDTTVTSVGPGEPVPPIPRVFSLAQNYPNPFNPTTTIAFDLPGKLGEELRVRLTIHDVRGRLVKTLIDGAVEPGTYRVTWDGRNECGEPVSSGMYFSALKSGRGSSTRKMLLLK
jgi:hypothetical protein